MYKLICGQDPRGLGIEDPEGNWDMTAFRQHIDQCDKCKELASSLKDDIQTIFNDSSR